MKYSVAIVAIARLENPYINEWIDYHHKLGFDHFYVYDNSCGLEQHIDEVLTKENADVTTIIPAYDKTAYQKAAYNDAYKRFNDKHDYMLFIDIDEFFTLMKHKDVSEYIDYLNSKCPDFHSVRITWEMYDDNNTLERDIMIPVHLFFNQLATTPKALVDNNSSKCMVKTKILGMYFDHVHYSKSKTMNLITCDASGKRIHPSNQFVNPRDISVAKIRHYATKTISEYMNQKLKRGDADGYIVRDINNRFFIYCKKTKEKMAYYEEHKKGKPQTNTTQKVINNECKIVKKECDIKTNDTKRIYWFG